MGFYSEENCQTEAHEPLLDWASGRKAPVYDGQFLIISSHTSTINCPDILDHTHMILSSNNCWETELHWQSGTSLCNIRTKYFKYIRPIVIHHLDAKYRLLWSCRGGDTHSTECFINWTPWSLCDRISSNETSWSKFSSCPLNRQTDGQKQNPRWRET